MHFSWDYKCTIFVEVFYYHEIFKAWKIRGSNMTQLLSNLSRLKSNLELFIYKILPCIKADNMKWMHFFLKKLQIDNMWFIVLLNINLITI